MTNFYNNENKVRRWSGLLLLCIGFFLLYIFYYPPEPVGFQQFVDRLHGKDVKVEHKVEKEEDRGIPLIKLVKKRIFEDGRGRILFLGVGTLIFGLYLILKSFEETVDEKDTNSAPDEELSEP